MRTPDDVVAENIAELRTTRRHTVRSLSALLGRLGHPILPSGVTKIEQRERRVDAGDLIALAVALGVNPNRLLLPAGDPHEEVALTPTVSARQFQAWAWARGAQVLLPAEAKMANRSFREAQDDFRRHALPASERLRDDHTVVRAARDVLDRVVLLLEIREDREREEADDRTVAGSAADLRRALARLVAEVDDLIGDGEVR